MERIYSTSGLTATNGKDILNVIANNISTLGWTVIDDQITASSYVVVYSEGHTKNNNRLPCYVRFKHGTTFIQMQKFVYWDSSAHAGFGMVSINTPTSAPAGTDVGAMCDQTTYNNLSLRGNKDFLQVTITRPSTNITYSSIILRIDNPMWNYIAEWQSATAAGLDTVVQLKSGEAVQFKIGSSYRIVSPVGYITKANVVAKDLNANTITLNSTPYPLVSGTKIGSYPFPWISMGTPNNAVLKYALSYATVDHYSSTTNAGTAITGAKGLVNQTYNNDMHNHGGEISLFPFLFYESAYGSFGTSSYLQYYNTSPINYGDVMGINNVDAGTVSSATSTQLTDSNKSWVVDVFAGHSVIITSGEQQEVLRYIVSNTADTLTVTPSYTPTISGGVTFTICEAFYVLTNKPETFMAIKAI